MSRSPDVRSVVLVPHWVKSPLYTSIIWPPAVL